MNYLWIKNNLCHLPPRWDQSDYMYMSLHEYETFLKGNIFQFLKVIITQAPVVAPLFPVTAIPFFALSGLDICAAYLVNFLYLFILLLSVFFIAKRSGTTGTGFFSVYLVATFPAVIAFSRDFLYEFPLAALTALSYLFFQKSESFEKTRESVLFGICTGLSLLTKTMGIVFFVMPFMYAAYLFIRTKDKGILRKNIIYAFTSALIVASIYYIPNFKNIFGYLFYEGLGEGSKNYNFGISDMFSIPYWTIYFKHITQRGISLSYFFIFVLSMVFYLFTKKKKLSKDYLLVWLWLICGYILLSLPENKGGERYALPIMAPIAIIMAFHVMNISLKPLKYFILSLAIAIGLINYTYQTKSKRCEYNQFYYKDNPILVPLHETCNDQETFFLTGDQAWDLTTLLHTLETFHNKKSSIINVLAAVDHPFLNGSNLRLFAKLEKLKERLASEFRVERITLGPNKEEEMNHLIKESDFIIIKTGLQGPDFSNANNALVRKIVNNMPPLKSFVMSDGSAVLLYRGMAP